MTNMLRVPDNFNGRQFADFYGLSSDTIFRRLLD
jgi:hypothetical protein